MKAISANVLLKGVGAVEADVPVTAVVTDSRQVEEGSIFVCIKGERVDGHDYAKTAVENGCVAIVAQHEVQGVNAAKTVIVEDPLDAMIAMGANYRDCFAPLVIGVTGSVGKTTTKEFCSAVFSSFGNTLKTQGNQNNEIGMPKTLMQIDDETEYAIIEMGMQGMGEIRKLTVAAKPDAAIITCIGTAHLKQLGSRQNICDAKMEICEGIKDGGVLVLNGDDDMLINAQVRQGVNRVFFAINNKDAHVFASDIQQSKAGTNFVINDVENGAINAYIPSVGVHNVSNALSAYAVATRLGLDAKKAAKALCDYKTTGYRQNIVEHCNVTVIEDCYNASPDSVTAAIKMLRDLPVKGIRIAVLGDMLELGDITAQAHDEVGYMCADNDIAVLITVGEAMRAAHNRAHGLGVEAVHCDNNAAAAQLLTSFCNSGDTVLVKASRGMQFEEILKGFYDSYKCDSAEN